MYGMYDRDLIAERDARERMHSSLVKWWRVNYVDNRGRLRSQEAQMNTGAYAMQNVGLADAVSDQLTGADYNAAESSYADFYGGQGGLDDQIRNQVDSIVNEKKNSFLSFLSDLTLSE